MSSTPSARTGPAPDATAATAATPAAPQHRATRDHRWIVLAVIGIAQLAVVLDATIVNIALPSAQQQLGFADDQRQWIVTAYSLAFGSLLLLGGRLGDLFGRKNLFILGLAGFAAASVVGGLAQDFSQLVAARALQGVFGALLAPSALALLTTTFTDPAERARAFGVFGAIAGSGAATGVLLGGVLTEYTSWRWCLYVNVVFAVVGVLGRCCSCRSRHAVRGRVSTSSARSPSRSASSASSTGSPPRRPTGGRTRDHRLARGRRRARRALRPRRVAGVAPAAAAADRARPRPRGALTAIGLVGVAMFGIFLFLTYYLTQTLGFSSLETGLSFLPMPLSIMTAATQITPRLLPRVGPKVLLRAGGLVAAAGILLFLRTDVDSTWAGTVLPALVVTGLGMGLTISSAMNTATSGVAREDAGAASASVNTFQQIGGSIGTALLSTVFASSVRNAGGTPAEAVLHGYHVAFAGGALAVLLVAVVSATLVNRHSVRQERLAGLAAIPAPSTAH